ncbi:hypothetical protein [Tamlana sp. I1]|uniref:hypothetical protein n=1 Tax=Tamlana sp. I1 TaxID=2762061 RepID=UPI0018905F5B|nr:hypothetical protein [Tamlana sp. I1]
MKKHIILIIGLILFGCKTKNPTIKFIYLDKSSDKVFDSDRGNSGYGEVILIDNLPTQKDTILSIQKAYFNSKNKICLLSETKDYYSMTFYKKTSCTEYFIDRENDFGGFSRTVIFEDCKSDELFSFYYERDKKNPNLWVANMKEELFGYEYHDTIYCELNHKKVKLPDMPQH